MRHRWQKAQSLTHSLGTVVGTLEWQEGRPMDARFRAREGPADATCMRGDRASFARVFLPRNFRGNRSVGSRIGLAAGQLLTDGRTDADGGVVVPLYPAPRRSQVSTRQLDVSPPPQPTRRQERKRGEISAWLRRRRRPVNLKSNETPIQHHYHQITRPPSAGRKRG